MEMFYIKLRNNTTGADIKVNIRPEGNALSDFWIDTMKSNFLIANNASKNKPLNKLFCLHAWQKAWEDPNYSRNLRAICEELNTAISKVNFYYGAHGYPHISLAFNPEKLEDINWYRSAMNELHHHFELLIGQVDNTSEWYYRPNNKGAVYYVQQLNSLLHEIESIVNRFQLGNQDQKCILINWMGPRTDGEYDPEPIRYTLNSEHYDCFQDTGYNWGMVTVYYSQLGKQHIEVYLDGDDVIGDENISNVKYMLGDCIINLPDVSPHQDPGKRFTPEYVEWLEKNKVNWQDKNLGLGVGVLARIHEEDNTHLGTWQEIDQAIWSCDDVYEVGFHINNIVTASKTYNYTWREFQTELLGNLENKNT